MSEHTHATVHVKNQDVQQSIQLIPDSGRESIVPSSPSPSSSPRSSATQTSRTTISKPPWLTPSWTRRRATIALIVMFFVFAVLLAVAHAIFYIRLNGTLAENRLLEQSEVIAISLLITTLFRACLVASIGLSFTQHLWKIFRQKLLRISQIEQLFHLRFNPLELAKVKIVKHTPFLFLMAVFIWLLPIAVVYPPSSLTVTSQPYSSMRNVSLSVMNVPPPDDLDVLRPNHVSVPSLAYLRRASTLRDEEMERPNATVTYDYVKPSRPLLSLVKLVLLTGEILEFPSPKSENISYALEYRTLQVACREETNNWTYYGDMRGLQPTFAIEWGNTLSWMNPLPVFNISRIRYPGVYAFNSALELYEYAVSTESRICEPFSVLMHLNVSYTRGVRHISHVMQDAQPMPNVTQSVYSFPYDVGKPRPNASDVPVDTPEYAKWESETRVRLTDWDIYAPMDASFRSLTYTWDGIMGMLAEADQTKWNGTLVPFSGADIQGADTIFEWSVLNTQRYNATSVHNTEHEDPWDMNWYYDQTIQEIFDPRRDLNLSEAMLNDFLTNVSISAITLDTWRVPYPANITEYRTTYHFSSPIKLVVPYALSLGIALAFVGIGVWSLMANGVPATDGGFLQVVTTTTGRTEMEKLIEKDKEEEGGVVRKELLNMRIRYGELVDEGGVGTGRAGFGTLAETRPLGQKTSNV